MRNKAKILIAVSVISLSFSFLHQILIIKTGLFIHSVLIMMAIVCSWFMYKQLISLRQDLNKHKEEYNKLNKELEKLQYKNQEYEMLFHSLEGAIFSFDVKTNETYFSKGMEDITGYSANEFIQNPNFWKAIIHSEDLPIVIKNEQQLRAGESTRVEYRILHKVHGAKWIVNISQPVLGEDGSILKINGQLIDISERKQLEEELKQMAFHDDLTDLPNRKALDRHIEKALARSKRHHHNFTLMFIDLDDFKIVNDTLGHDAGDMLLKDVVTRINACIREEDLVARIGGDEFIVVFEETNKDEIEEIAKRILENVSNPYMIHENEAKISLSIGVSMYPDDGQTKQTLIENADKAMYFAKNNGKNNIKLYSPELNEMELKKVGLLERFLKPLQKAKNILEKSLD
ncbi:sensor domain-containing protein [Bacillus alkalisoli]|uniref:sensor domain-containing protein n=1 Tax=Bacillus alkalisoli TaxID=2011008 RepID=UPI000C250269|nr:sensor domain-containing diguanylate cyclase [Bacillus alkalisoli]